MLLTPRKDGFTWTCLALLFGLQCFLTFSSAASPEFDLPVQTGTMQSSLLSEISGIAASRMNPGVLWVHNDSGDSARIFAITSAGKLLGTYKLGGATNTDFEDIAVGPGPDPGKHYIYVADTGNNNLDRTVLKIYRIVEPVVSNTQASITTTIGPADITAFPVQYPDGARHDCETLLVDPIYGDILLVTRDRAHTGNSYVFLFPHADQRPGVIATLQPVTTLHKDGEIKSGDVSPDGRFVILRPHSSNHQLSALLWERRTGSTEDPALPAEPIANVFRSDNPVSHAPLPSELHGEAIGFAADGSGYFTTSEGPSQPIYWTAQRVAPVAPPVTPTGLSAHAGNAQITLSWDANETASSYTLKRSTNGAPYEEVTALSKGATSFTDSTVQNDVPYSYVISVSNEAGNHVDSAPVPTAAGCPKPPSALLATVLGKSQIRLTWTDNAINEEGFYVEMSSDGKKYRQTSTLAVDTTQTVINNVPAGKNYHFRIRSFNDAGTSEYSPTVSVKTK